MAVDFLKNLYMGARISPIVFAALVILQCRLINGATYKLNIDFAIVIHGDIQIYNDSVQQLQKVLREELPKAFDIDQEKTRLALISTAGGDPPNIRYDDTTTKVGGWRIDQGITGEFTQFDRALSELDLSHGNRNITDALIYARFNIFGDDKNEPSVVFIFSICQEYTCGQAGGQNKLTDATVKQAAADLRSNTDALIFVIVEAKDATYTNDYAILTGNANNVIKSKRIAEDTLDGEFKDILLPRVAERLCEYTEACFFTEGQAQCQKQWYTPRVPKKGGDCNAAGHPAPASSGQACQPMECEKTCDDKWEWHSEYHIKCDRDCGKELERDGEMRWQQLQYCSTSKPHCPPCTTKRPKSSSPTEKPEPTSFWTLTMILQIVLPVCGVIILLAIAIAGVLIWRMKSRHRRLIGALKRGRGLKKGAGDIEKGKKSKSKSKPKSKDKSKKAESEKSQASATEKKAKGKPEQESSLSKKDDSEKVETEKPKSVSRSVGASMKSEPIVEKSKAKSKAKVKSKAKAVVACKIPTKKGKKTMRKI